MKKILLVLTIIIVTLPVGACSSDSDESLPILSLADSPDILDIADILPDRFEEYDPASLEMSNEDLELGPDFSEVVVFISEEPYEVIWGFMVVSKSLTDVADMFLLAKNDNEIKELVTDDMRAQMEGEEALTAVPDITISHPSLGNSATYAQGIMDTSEYYFGHDIYFYRSRSAYVVFYSIHTIDDKVSLHDIFEDIDEKLSNYDY